MVIALAYHQCDPVSLVPGPGVICGSSVFAVVGPRLAPRVFLRVLRFSSLHKNHHFKILIGPG